MSGPEVSLSSAGALGTHTLKTYQFATGRREGV